MKKDTLQTRVERAYRLNRLKKIFIMLMLVIVVFTSFTMFTPSANAACSGKNPCKGCQGTPWLSKRDEIQRELGDTAAFVFDVTTIAGNCNPHFNFSTIAANIYKFSRYQGKWTSLSSETQTLMSAGVAMYNVMKVVGVCLIFLFFLIDLLDEVQADHFTIEHLIKKLLTLTVAIIVMQMGAEIFTLLMEMGDTMIDDASVAAGTGNVVALDRAFNTVMAVKPTGGFFSTILMWMALIAIFVDQLIPYVLMLAASIIAYLVGFSRFIEILVRFAFAPIGIAQLVSGGAKGPGMRYIKKFASCCLQGGVAVLAFGTVTIISNLAAGINAILASILVPITLIGFLMKIGRVADDIVGI